MPVTYIQHRISTQSYSPQNMVKNIKVTQKIYQNFTDANIHSHSKMSLRMFSLSCAKWMLLFMLLIQIPATNPIRRIENGRHSTASTNPSITRLMSASHPVTLVQPARKHPRVPVSCFSSQPSGRNVLTNQP